VEAENLAGVNLIHLFAADAILPGQVSHQPADRWLQRLCLAILEEALGCLEGKGSPGGRVYHGEAARRSREAWEWFLSDAEYCFSFTIVCAVLDLNTEAVRRAVRRRFAQGALPCQTCLVDYGNPSLVFRRQDQREERGHVHD
jgi:hypothetical protein